MDDTCCKIWLLAVLYCTVLYCTILYCTALHCSECTIVLSTVLYCNSLHCLLGLFLTRNGSTVGRRLTILRLQQTGQSSCSRSMFNGIRQEPTNKRFNSAYLQIKYPISRKIHINTFWLEKLFPVDHKSPWCSTNKDFLKTKKSKWDFQLGTPRPSPPSKTKQVSLEKSLRLHTRGSPAAAAEVV